MNRAIKPQLSTTYLVLFTNYTFLSNLRSLWIAKKESFYTPLHYSMFQIFSLILTLDPNLYHQMGCIFCRHKITHFHLSKFYIFSPKKKRQKKWLLPGKKWWTYPSGNFSELGSLAVYSISYSLHIHITKKWQKLPASMRSIYFILSRVMKKNSKKNFFLPIS